MLESAGPLSLEIKFFADSDSEEILNVEIEKNGEVNFYANGDHENGVFLSKDKVALLKKFLEFA